jgi:radical SAM protein with 4Fe4S-binding SPASM domain
MNILKTLKNSYYVPGSDASWIGSAFKRTVYRQVPEFPRLVQIETRTGCNASCVFCPISDKEADVPKGRMTDVLFEKIVKEIGKYGTTRRISPYLTNEPFVDKTIVEKSRYIKRHVPKAKVVITTNAGVLFPRVVDDILRDNPFHAIYISMQGIEKGPYEATMQGSLVFEETKQNVEYLIRERNRLCPGLQITVTMVKTHLIDTEAAVRYWRSLGVEAKCTALENRGGSIADFDGLSTEEGRLFRDCTRLFKNAYITFDGDMVLCCADYYREVVLGNVRDRSIHDVWNSPLAQETRRAFVQGNMENNSLCANCQIAPLI